MSKESRESRLAEINKSFDKTVKKKYAYSKNKRFIISKRKQSKFDNQVTQIFQVLDIPMSNRITASINIQCLGDDDEENIGIVMGLISKFCATLTDHLVSDDSLSIAEYEAIQEEEARRKAEEESGEAKRKAEEDADLQSISKDSFVRKSDRVKEDNETLRRRIAHESLESVDDFSTKEKTPAERLADAKREMQLLEEEIALSQQVAALRAKKAKLAAFAEPDADVDDEDDSDIGDISDSDMADLRFGYDN